MKEIFRAGDKVELLPYDQVKNHLGVSRQTWEQLCSIIPMTIDFIDGDDLCTRETGFFFKRAAFVRHVEYATEVGDLL